MINLRGEVTLFKSKYSEYLNTCIIKGMVEIYDIMNITCQNLYHMPYQPSTYIIPGWYRVLGLIRHVIQILTCNIQHGSWYHIPLFYMIRKYILLILVRHDIAENIVESGVKHHQTKLNLVNRSTFEKLMTNPLFLMDIDVKTNLIWYVLDMLHEINIPFICKVASRFK
jgi:hypothetical protein